VIPIAFPLQQRLHDRFSMLCFTLLPLLFYLKYHCAFSFVVLWIILVPAGAVAPLPAFLPSYAPYWVKVTLVPLAPNYREMQIDAYKRYKNTHIKS
jgi:hypothetical protein